MGNPEKGKSMSETPSERSESERSARGKDRKPLKPRRIGKIDPNSWWKKHSQARKAQAENYGRSEN